MKKLFISLVVGLAIFTTTVQAQAQPGLIGVHGYGGLPYGTWLSCSNWVSWLPWLVSYPWLTVPGCEAQMVVWGNQDMVWDIGRQWQQPWYPQVSQPGYSQWPGYAPSPLPQQQYIIVRVPKSRGHQWQDIGGWSALGAAIVGGVTRSAEGAAYGALGGFGGGMLYTQHEYDSYAVLLPAPPQPPQTQPLPQPQPGVVPVVRATPAFSGIPMVIVNESDFWIHVENEATGEGVAILGPKIEASDLQAPQGRLRFRVIIPENGVMTGREIVPESDPTLPGWRIPPQP